MRRLIPLLLSLSLLLCACSSPKEEAPPPPPDRPASSKAFGKRSPQTVVDQTKVRTDLISFRAEIKLRMSSEGAYPSEEVLSRLETQYEIGVEYDYDPATGEIRSRTFPRY